MKSLLISTAITCTFASTLFAGNLVVPAPAPAPIAPVAAATDWNGFYAGVQASSDTGTFDFLNADGSLDSTYDLLGNQFGAFAGYHVQNGAFVFGGELAYSAGDVYMDGFPTWHYTNMTDLKARVGYAAGQALIYATAGASVGNWDNSGMFGSGIQAVGYNFGVGIDLQVNDRFFVGAEYLFREMGGEFPLVLPPLFESHTQSIQLRAGISF